MDNKVLEDCSDLESQLNEVPPLEGSVCAGHGYDLSLLHQQVVDTVSPAAQ